MDDQNKGMGEKNGLDLRYRGISLLQAAKQGDASAVEALLGCSRIDPNVRDEEGRTPLSVAVLHGHDSMVKVLLQNDKVQPDSRDDRGQTPLSHATFAGQETVVRLLLDDERVDPGSKDMAGNTPLLRFVQSRRRPAIIANILLETGRSCPDQEGAGGFSPLWWAISNGDASLIKVLLDAVKYDFVERDVSLGRELFMSAVRNNKKRSVQALLVYSQVDPNFQDNNGTTPLICALEYGHQAVLDILLGCGRLHAGPQATTGLEISAEYVQGWKNACDTHHEGRCKPCFIKHGEYRQNPHWVIDTARGCLVPGHSVPQYVALSYVWSNTSGESDLNVAHRILLTKANLVDFQRPGCLLQDDIAALLPYSVQDAMVLVRMMGEIYLWVDCLCIVQDDEYTREEVESMGDIYSGASLTIIAATTFGRLSARRVKRRARLGKGLVRILYERLLRSNWATRGWTFQEQMLSMRSVIFVEGETFWDCQQCTWSGDDMTPESHPNSAISRPYYEAARRMATISWPDFGMYIEMVGLYNSRHLTYPQDALPAISGALNTLMRSFPSGFVSGLPRSFIDVALLWQPFSRAERRVAKGGNSIAPTQHMPSWSWCGWQCPIDPFSSRGLAPYVDEDTGRVHQSTWRTHRLVQWYALSGNMESESRIDTTELPFEQEGLSRHDDSSHTEHESLNVSENSTLYHECHEKHQLYMPNTAPPFEEYEPDTGEKNHAQLLDNTWPFLSCMTTRASFTVKTNLKAGRQPPMASRPSPSMAFIAYTVPIFKLSRFANAPEIKDICHLICLEDKSGAPAGLIRHMTDAEVKPGDIVELVAISRGSFKSKDMVDRHQLGPVFTQERQSETDGSWCSEYQGM